VKSFIIAVALAVLLAACAHQETQLGRQIVGTWRCGSSNEWVFGANGRFALKFGGSIGEGEFDGTWRIRDNILIMKITSTYIRGATNLFTVNGILNPERHSIFLIDAAHLAVISDQRLDDYGLRTNVWERQE
jgi:hypothetical protein